MYLQGERFHQDLINFEKRFASQGKDCIANMLADYVYQHVAQSDPTKYSRKTKKQMFYNM